MPAFSSKALDLQVRAMANLFSNPPNTSFSFISIIWGNKGRNPTVDGLDGVAR